MNSHEAPIVPISTPPPLARGVKRPPDDSDCDLEAPQASRARPWPLPPPSLTSKESHAPTRWHAAGQSCEQVVEGGESSADSAGGTRGSGGGGDGDGGGSSTLVDSNPAAMMLRSNKRLRAEDTVESAVPAKRLRRYELCCDPAAAASSSSPTSNAVCVSSSRLSKWQSPRTSPLGPKSSTYCRLSRESLQPSIGPGKARPTLLLNCIYRNFYKDNVMRNPYEQSSQWCQDLRDTGLNDTLHPRYVCQHRYHPSDPEYDEEWLDESWSDEEWSDSEDSLTSSDEDQPDAPQPEAAAQVRIITPEEPSQAGSGSNATFTFVHWNSWGLTSRLSWDPSDADSESVESDDKAPHDGAFSDPADMAAKA